MERLGRRRTDPAAIDITWVSCRGVRSSLPFHTPCLYASVFVVRSSARNAHGHRRHHRVKTHTDRAGGGNPEWDAPLRLYLPEPPEAEAGKNDDSGDGDDDVLLVRFELKAEVAVLGDVHAASAAVPVPDLVPDGRTRRVSYQLLGPDGRQPNGVISFSYAFHERNDDDDGQSSDGADEPATPPCPAPAASTTDVSLPPPMTITAAPRLYPEIEWALTEQPGVYPPVTATSNFTVVDTQQYYPPATPPPAPLAEPASVYPPAPPAESAWVYPPAPPVEHASVYPPPVPEKSLCSVYPTVLEPVKATALYPTVVDVAPVSYYPPPPAYGVECGYTVAPRWGDRPGLYG